MSYQISNTQHLGENTRNQTRDTFTDYRNYSLKDKKITYKNNNLNQNIYFSILKKIFVCLFKTILILEY